MDLDDYIQADSREPLPPETGDNDDYINEDLLDRVLQLLHPKDELAWIGLERTGSWEVSYRNRQFWGTPYVDGTPMLPIEFTDEEGDVFHSYFKQDFYLYGDLEEDAKAIVKVYDEAIDQLEAEHGH